jgi:hypothetical protein
MCFFLILRFNFFFLLQLHHEIIFEENFFVLILKQIVLAMLGGDLCVLNFVRGLYMHARCAVSEIERERENKLKFDV